MHVSCMVVLEAMLKNNCLFESLNIEKEDFQNIEYPWLIVVHSSVHV